MVDLGIVFNDKSNYLCWPLERIGISKNSKVTSVSTSCECASARIVEYKKGLSESPARAVLIAFEPPAIAKGTTDNTYALLGIVVKLVTDDGVLHQLTVKVVHTVRLNV